MGVGSKEGEMAQTAHHPDAMETNETHDDLQKVEFCPDCKKPMIRVPALQCAHCDVRHPLRCFVYRSRDGFVAECIDLDILSQGVSEVEAIGRLQEAVFSYLETAFDGGPTHGLVLRLSPLSHRVHYHAQRFLALLRAHGVRSRHFVPQSSKNRLLHC
jgi:hypothetical protein